VNWFTEASTRFLATFPSREGFEKKKTSAAMKNQTKGVKKTGSLHTREEKNMFGTD